jgi:hypothetical protein
MRNGPAFELLHSPSVGPATWEPVAAHLRAQDVNVAVPDLRSVSEADPPYWREVVQRARDGLRDVPAENALVLCAHSNAGLFLPVVAASLDRPVAAFIFVDASLPPNRGAADMVPAEYLSALRLKATDGRVQKWTEWFEEPEVAALFPDGETRRRITDEQRALPLAYYEEAVPVPEGWTDIPSGYLLFGPPYDSLAAEARRRGWPLKQVPGQHLHMVVDPEAVAGALSDLASSLV